MTRLSLSTAVIAIALLNVGCSGTPRMETLAYPLKLRSTEEPIIKAILADEGARIGPRKMAAAVNRYGGKMEALSVTPDDVAIVRATPRGHAEIRKALSESRKDAQTLTAAPPPTNSP